MSAISPLVLIEPRPAGHRLLPAAIPILPNPRRPMACFCASDMREIAYGESAMIPRNR